MEKKRNQLARGGQGSCDFKSNNNKDVSSKQVPRQRRRESFQQDNNSKPQQQSIKNRNNNHYFDKRPPTRKGGFLEQQEGEATGLTEADELNSVFNHGSRKQNLNHLLNFHYYSAKESAEARAGTFSKHGYHHHKTYSKKFNFNKEQYLQANCQFVVKADGYDYRPFAISPDSLVDWSQVVKILVSSYESAQCPICLYPPKAAKMTRCGHIYCYSCVLHYLSLSDKTWRKCPICYESIHLVDLKSTTSKHNHRSYKVGDIIPMELMRREKGSLCVTKADEVRHGSNQFASFSEGEENFTYSKLIMADSKEVLKILEQEKLELEFQLIEDGLDCPESVFVQQAMDFVNTKQKELEEGMKEVAASSKFSLNPSVAEFVPSAKQEVAVVEDSVESHEKRNELIDDECNLTVNDIDIVPAAPSKNFFYYQAPNAQNIFLHSINSRMLQQMFESLDKSPQKITGKIVQIECCTMDEALRKRLKYLQHLPVSSVFEVVEIEFESGFVPVDVIDSFSDELLHRRKIRQRRERDERKHEKAINEINDRQMGKMMKAAAANINIGSTLQFPECGSFSEMPALSNASDGSASPALSSSPAGPSFANMLTTSTARKSAKLWPSLSTSDGPSTSSFFGNDTRKLVHVSGNKQMMATPQPKPAQDDDDDDIVDDEVDCKVPAYKNQLGDCLANALAKSVSLKEVKGGKKKKAKKTLLFASGMNFN